MSAAAAELKRPSLALTHRLAGFILRSFKIFDLIWWVMNKKATDHLQSFPSPPLFH